MKSATINQHFLLYGFLLRAWVPGYSQIKVQVLSQALDYSFGYDKDLTSCFLLPDPKNPNQARHQPEELAGLATDPTTRQPRPGQTGDHWLVVFQAHTQQELNLTNTFVPNMRTLKWGTPYDNAVMVIKEGGSAHQYSALLRDWYMQKVRKFATFICIPPHQELRFLSGYAAPMESRVKDEEGNPAILKESRPGGGMQWRFYSLPKGTICLTTRLFTEASGKTKDKENKSVDLQARLKECVDFYNKNPVNGIRLPMDLAKPRSEIKNAWDDEEIVTFYFDHSRSSFKTYVPGKP